MLKRLAKSIDRKNLFLPLFISTSFYDRLDVRPGNFTRILTMMFSMLARNSQTKSLHARRLEAVNLPTSSLESEHDLPPIELLIVCAKKDIEFLPRCIAAAYEHSRNDIGSMTVVVPEDIVGQCEIVLRSLPYQINVFSELEYITPATLAALKRSFGARYGWLLQQHVTVEFVRRSGALAVLTIDADTIVVRDTAWVDVNGFQLLHASSEYVPDYYKFLYSIGASELEPQYTHVTHHMLMQPNILREILADLSLPSAEDLTLKAIAFAETTGQRLFCLEFELYAQGMWKMYPHLVRVAKFGNRTVYVSDVEEAGVLLAATENADNGPLFNSLSFHSYARNL